MKKINLANQDPNSLTMESALILKDKKTNKIFHVILGENNKLQKYIDPNEANKIEYTIIADWKLVKEAVKFLIQK
jgi:hypothetical protein